MKSPIEDKAAADRRRGEQTRQRVRVGMLGLAVVVLLIGLASAIFSSVNREAPLDVSGAAQPGMVANMSAPGAAPGPTPSSEPLAEMGVTPSTANTPAAVATGGVQ
ncbi:MAG: hypothetical protein DI544_00375 [Sphingomonas taxi]|uniref:Uncharacterized protein n=1 Tax=Sphingomonas taxi TaxID=1549858 RepID=A0A2W5PF71_9SPHN|nr:MAG: hypothetical protein DI544_00375 [Sphingomonas taxi]